MYFLRQHFDSKLKKVITDYSASKAKTYQYFLTETWLIKTNLQ